MVHARRFSELAAPVAFLWGALTLCACAGLPRASQDPLTPDEHMRLGASYEDQGLRSSAAKEYGAALREQKDFVPALIALGNLAFQDGSLVEAEIYYRKVLAKEPDQPSANNNLAVVYLTRGSRLDTAQQLAERALKAAGPLRPYVLDTLAHVYMKEGKAGLARAALDQADAAAPAGNIFLRQRLYQTRRQLEAIAAVGGLKGR